MRIFRKDKDEREKNEIMRISSIAFWITLWGLIISIIVKLFIFDLDLIYTATEFIILIVCTIYIVIACYYRGIWDNKTNPGVKVYLFYSFVIALLTNIPIYLIFFIRYEVTVLESLRFFATGVFVVFISVFVALAIVGTIIKRRQKKLVDKYSNDENS